MTEVQLLTLNCNFTKEEADMNLKSVTSVTQILVLTETLPIVKAHPWVPRGYRAREGHSFLREVSAPASQQDSQRCSLLLNRTGSPPGQEHAADELSSRRAPA